MTTLRVRAKGNSYDVVVGRGSWKALQALKRHSYTSVFVLTERGLWDAWGKKFERAIGWKKCCAIIVPTGESSKSMRMVERVAGDLLDHGADRRSLLIAFGGGVIGDLGGFVASTYMRGIDYVQVPTTVVAQVDSAIGGKTAVNVGSAKNLVGTIAPPRLVLADPVVLTTLDTRTFRSGLYEVVKHGILSGPQLFRQLEETIDSLVPSNAPKLGPLLARAAQVKVEVVSRDERESGLRRSLNLGHTFGHAFEAATRYRRFLHGEAVAWGMIAATVLASRAGLIKQAEAMRITNLIRRVGKLPPIHDLDAKRVMDLLVHDKKTVGGRVHWVLPERIGRVRVVDAIPATMAESALRETQLTRWS